jgi:tetratricopeptide (TPR) repeat protein
MVQTRHSPIIYEYLKKYQDDPTSRIFAPLAEAYRKAGLVDEAVEIAREGLRLHPNFIGGRVALARALFEKKLYAEVADELSRVVQDVPDNLVAQRLLGESCLMLGRLAEALSAYKMLLFFSPHDIDTAKVVQELEAQAYQDGVMVLRTDPKSAVSDDVPDFAERQAGSAINEDPGLKRARWIRRVEKLQGMLQRVERYRRFKGANNS